MDGRQWPGRGPHLQRRTTRASSTRCAPACSSTTPGPSIRPASCRWVRFTQTDATFYGGELEGAYDLWRGGDGVLSAEGSYDYVHGQTDVGPPARIPPYSVTGRLVWKAPRLEGQVEVRYVAEQGRLSAFELPTDAYTLLSARVSWRPLADQDFKALPRRPQPDQPGGARAHLLPEGHRPAAGPHTPRGRHLQLLGLRLGRGAPTGRLWPPGHGRRLARASRGLGA